MSCKKKPKVKMPSALYFLPENQRNNWHMPLLSFKGRVEAKRNPHENSNRPKGFEPFEVDICRGLQRVNMSSGWNEKDGYVIGMGLYLFPPDFQLAKDVEAELFKLGCTVSPERGGGLSYLEEALEDWEDGKIIPQPHVTEVVIFSKPECHLCDSAKYVIEKAGEKFDLEIREVDISAAGNEAEFERYQHDIPVIWINRQERFRWRVDPDELRTLLKSLSG